MKSNIQNRKEKKHSKSERSQSRGGFSFNIGTIVFGAVFLYMVISVSLYLTQEHISTYQVTAGPLAKNQSYVGLAIRNEEILYSNASGYVSYYAGNNTRVKRNGVIYGVGNEKRTEQSVSYTDAVLDTLRIDMASFSSGFNTNDYSDVYSFKYEIEGKLLQNTGTALYGIVSDSSQNVTIGNQTISRSPQDGLILYSMDGYEDFSLNQITDSSFNSKNYHLENLKTEDAVVQGAPICRLITDEAWSVIIPLTDRQVIQLADRSSIRVKFLKDDVTQNADLSIYTSEDGAYYGELKFSSGVIRYSSERFIELELVTNTTSGLKIPVSAVVNKQFYTIPKEYSSKGGDSGDVGFLIQRNSGEKNAGAEFVQLTIYEEKDDMYYVDTNDIDAGDVIIQTESNARYVVKDTDTLEGVYCINKGYAVFRKIVIVDKNDQYCIVRTDTPYGIAQFDHIVEDSSTVKEQEILY